MDESQEACNYDTNNLKGIEAVASHYILKCVWESLNFFFFLVYFILFFFFVVNFVIH